MFELQVVWVYELKVKSDSHPSSYVPQIKGGRLRLSEKEYLHELFEGQTWNFLQNVYCK